jgi:TfoX N-terminal domain
VAYDEALADRLREILYGEDDLTELHMFGGLAFLLGGNMAVSASGQGGLLLRVDPADPRDLSGEPGVLPFVMRGRPMEGWLRIGVDGIRTRRELEGWAAIGVAYARSLPPKGSAKH